MLRTIRIPALLSVGGKVVGLGASFYIALILGPENFAFYALWLLLIEYLAYFNLGMGPAIFRNVSISENVKSHKQSQQTIDLAATTLLVTSLVGFCLIFVGHVTKALPIQMSNLEFFLLVFARIIDIWFGLTKSIAKGFGMMLPQAWVEGVLAVIVPLMNIVAITFLGILGLMIVHLLTSSIGIMIFRCHNIRLTFSLFFDYDLIKKLLKVSLPLFSANLLEATLITLPIMLSGYVIEGLSLGGFLYLFQNSKPEKIPLYSYFTNINFRSLLIEASNDPKFGTTDTWERVDISLKSYFMLTAIGTTCMFVALNYISRYVLHEYISYLPLVIMTLPSLAFFSLRRIFNAYFSAVNQLTKRLAIYTICLMFSLGFFGYAQSVGIIDIRVLAVWISLLATFSSTLGLVAFLKDVGHNSPYILKQLIFIYTCLLVSYFFMDWLLYFSESIGLTTFLGAAILACISLLYIAVYSSTLLCIAAFFTNQSPRLYLKRLAASNRGT